MKRKAMVGAAVVLAVCLMVSLWAVALDPAAYTGRWYHWEDGAPYQFEHGLIYRENPDNSLWEFAGAYHFSQNRALVLLLEKEEKGQLLELSLVRRKEGDVLADPDTDQGVFFRNRQQALAGGGVRLEEGS